MRGAPERADRFCEKGATSKARIRRKMITQTRPRQPDACYANHCSSGVLYHTISRSCGTSCVNGRAHATARRRSPPQSPGDYERAWARSRKTEPRPRRENEAGARCVRCLPHAGARRSGSASASRHRQRTQQAQHAGASEDASHVGARASQLLWRGS